MSARTAKPALVFRTDTIDGNPIGEPISAPVYHDMADLETLLTYVWATLEPVMAE